MLGKGIREGRGELLTLKRDLKGCREAMGVCGERHSQPREQLMLRP